MNYTKAIETRNELNHLIGSGYDDFTIDDILVMPNDAELFPKAVEIYKRNLSWEQVSSMFSYEGDFKIILVLNKRKIIQKGVFLYRNLESALKKFNMTLEDLLDGRTFMDSV